MIFCLEQCKDLYLFACVLLAFCLFILVVFIAFFILHIDHKAVVKKAKGVVGKGLKAGKDALEKGNANAQAIRGVHRCHCVLRLAGLLTVLAIGLRCGHITGNTADNKGCDFHLDFFFDSQLCFSFGGTLPFIFSLWLVCGGVFINAYTPLARAPLPAYEIWALGTNV